MSDVWALLTWQDWVALAAFFGLWMGYVWFASYSTASASSLLATTNRYRGLWMLQATAREPRMLDGLITQTLSNTPAFFSSTSILVIGGLFALLGTTEKAAQLIGEIPFAQATPVVVFEVKVLLLLAIFVYAFFRFSWCMRLYSFVALAIGAMPPPDEFSNGTADRTLYAHRASTLVGAAAETFNGGVRAYYFAFAALAWFLSPWAMVVAAVVVVAVLYSREFRSHVLNILND